MKLRFKIFWLSLKNSIKKVLFNSQLTLSGQYFLNYLKKKRAGKIDESNINVYYEKNFEKIVQGVGAALNKIGYQLNEADKLYIMDVVIAELESMERKYSDG